MTKEGINKLEFKIKELETQIEETKKRREDFEELEKKMDLDEMSVLDDGPLPKPPNHDSTFDNILKNLNIAICPSNYEESVYTK